MSMAAMRTARGNENLLHYYSGKIRAFWEDKIFFSDQRNVAVVSINNLFIHGEKATQADTAELEKRLENSSWNEAPELYAYVRVYRDPPSWPFNFYGKLPWLACYAWVGCIPESVEEEVSLQNAVYMPLSYYTGKPLKCFKDKILFGDLRNSVMVLKENLYIYGERCHNDQDGLDENDPLIHAYITKLDISDRKFKGPEPHLPTWPKDTSGPDTWVAKFAWQGEMPEVVRQQVRRFYVIRIYEWDNMNNIMGIKGKRSHVFPVGDQRVCHEDELSAGRDNSPVLGSEGANGIVRETRRLFSGDASKPGDAVSSLIPIQQHAGLMKGSLMMADHDQALMTSFVDVIAFTRDDFYINGEQFKASASLCKFFSNRIVPLMAWVVPMSEPTSVFNINVVWRAVCVWYGNTPKNLEELKKLYNEGMLLDNLIETSEPSSCKKLTHFMGVVTNLSFASGILLSKVSPKLTIKISFKRKSLYLYGHRFHSSCSLFDKQQTIESYTWSVLAYPIQEAKSGFPQYSAVAVWQYQYQHFLTNEFFLKALSDGENSQGDPHGIESKISPITEEWGKHMSGWIVKIKPDHGIIQSGSTQVDATCVYFKRSVLYVDGEILPRSIHLHAVDKYRQCNIYAKPTPPTLVDGITVTMEATLVWIGKKPQDIFTPSEVSTEEQCVPVATRVEETSRVLNEEAINQKHKPSGQMVIGSVLMVSENIGLITAYEKIVYFTIENFYVHGEKFKTKGRTMCEFLHSKKASIRAWIIPLDNIKLVLNCSVTHQAVCAWIGREPDELAVMQLKHKMPQDDGPVLHSWSSEIMFSHYVGKVDNVSTTSGIITCASTKGPVKAAFYNKVLFINGERLHEDVDLQNYSSLLSNSMWSVLAYTVLPREFMGEEVNAWAVALWHYKDQYLISTELQNITSTKAKQLAPVESRVPKAAEDLATTEKLLSGTIVCAEYDYGIILYGSEPTYVFFDKSCLCVEGTELDKNVSVKEFLMASCSFSAEPITVQEINYYPVSLLATVVKVHGRHPHANILEQSQMSSAMNSEESVNEVVEMLTNVSVGDTNGQSGMSKENGQSATSKEGGQSPTSKENGQSPVSKEKGHSAASKENGQSAVSKENDDCPYVGKHITGKIVHIGKDGGVLHWHSVKVEGNIYVEFISDDIYIDLHPLSSGNFSLEDVQKRCGNFYAVPIQHRTVNGYTVSLLATCGWIGQKPSFIPSPGKQGCPKINLDELHVTPIPSKAQRQNLEKRCDDSPKAGTLKALDSFSIPMQEEEMFSGVEAGLNGDELDWGDEPADFGHPRGIIIELHSNIGRLMTADGTHHYFSRDNCFLYGVLMKNVELWHVLVQGQEVTYKLGEIVAGASQVEAVWVGPPKCQNKQETAANISAWCCENLVPDGARDMLMEQLHHS